MVVCKCRKYLEIQIGSSRSNLLETGGDLLRNCTVSCTRSLFAENASVFPSTKYAWDRDISWFKKQFCLPDNPQFELIRTYSEWVIDGEYDWPPNCCHCKAVLEGGTDSQTTRLGCLHVIHTSCLVSHIKSFPSHTAPAGYVCPACSTSIWPPKSVKDSGSRLHTKLKEALMQVKPVLDS
ncbi:hypothetical protein TIFTF001_007168 [Ficus carica]|uniref:ZFPL1-like U-box domain-containing protein n=1 Tax=Ficus carica TaxID=3494 RepID=A0AA88A2C4_FICCA|nr:hypothetical protein TIFTF001_007168 [Ficus carica]